MKISSTVLVSVSTASLLSTLSLMPMLTNAAQMPSPSAAMAQVDTAPPESVTAADFIDIFEKLGGSHPGFRKAHAKGVCASAVFEPNTEAAQFKDSLLFTQGALAATVRFSLGSANPSFDERTPGARGMGIQIKVPNGGTHTITGNSAPVFTGKDPQTFFGFLSRLLPDENGQVNPARIGAYVAANPSVQASVMWSRTTPAPASFANTPYFGLHTFFYENPETQTQVKYRWDLSPALGNIGLSADDIAALPAEFLANKLAQQVADPDTVVAFTLTATIGEEGDTNIDPSQLWPQERTKVTMGTITITEVGEMACDKINFDPNILSAGFSPSEDPVLRMRSPAYGISFGKRLTNR